MKVVIIDDHTLFREGLQGLLERHGIEIVASSGNSQDGIKAAQELNPDVLLLDLRMPEMGGLEILEKLQEYKNELNAKEKGSGDTWFERVNELRKKFNLSIILVTHNKNNLDYCDRVIKL